MTENDRNQMVPFGQQRSLMAVDPAAVAAAEQAKARIQSAYLMAAYKPRNVDEARSRILRMCDDPEFAEKVEYSKPIGNKKIKDLSIRFAEMALAYYENILSEVQLLYDDDITRRIRISVIDLQTNTQFSRDVTLKKTIERKSKKGRDDDYVGERLNSYGETVYILKATDDEMLIKESAMASKFIRTEGLRLLPAGIKEEAKARARQTLAKRDKEDPNAAKKKLLDAFTGINIWPKDIEKYIGHNVDTISAAELSDLRTVYSAIDSGEANWSDYINRERTEEPKSKVAQKTKDAQQTETEKPESSEPKTPPAFAELVKKQAGKDFEYVATKDGIAHDKLSAFLEFSGKHNNISTFELMENIVDSNAFPGFWNGFVAGTWKQHFDGKLPETKKPVRDDTFQGHRSSQEGPSLGTTIGGNQKGEGAESNSEGADENNNQFDAVSWDSSKMGKVGLARFWETNKAEWAAAQDKSKVDFEKKWIIRFTENGSLTMKCPWKAVKEGPKNETPEADLQNERETGDEIEDPPNQPATTSAQSQNQGIDYNGDKGLAVFAKIQTDDAEGLIKACEAVGYGTNLVVPLSADARKKLHEKYLKLKQE